LCRVAAGWLTSCVGYLGVTVNDRSELEELFHVDLLVTCPPHFNVTFTLRNWRWRPDRTFDVLIDDAHSSYRVLPTALTLPDRHRAVACAQSDDVIGSGVGEWSAVAVVAVVVTVSVVAVGACAYAAMDGSRQRPTSPVDEPQVAPRKPGNGSRCAAAEASDGTSEQLTALDCTRLSQTSPVDKPEVALRGTGNGLRYAGLDRTRQCPTSPVDKPEVALRGTGNGSCNEDAASGRTRQRPTSTVDKREVWMTETGSGLRCAAFEALSRTRQSPTSAVDEPELALTATVNSYDDRRRRRTIVVVRVVLRLVFALSLTFTACSTAFYYSQWRRIDDVGYLPAARRRFDLAAAAALDRLVEHVTAGAEAGGVREMRRACDGYVADLAAAVSERVAAEARPGDAGSAAGRLYRRAVGRIADDLEQQIADLRRRLDARLRPAGARFRRLVRDSLRLPWFSYARNLFNRSAVHPLHSTPADDDDVSFLLPPETFTFADFLRIYSVEEVESWQRRFSKG